MLAIEFSKKRQIRLGHVDLSVCGGRYFNQLTRVMLGFGQILNHLAQRI